MKLLVFLIALALVGCAASSQPVQVSAAQSDSMAESPQPSALPDVDAEFESHFESGELKLKTIDRPGANANVISMAPFIRSTDLRESTDDGGMILFDGPAGAATDNGLEFHVFSIGQADSMLVIGPPPQKKTLLVDVGERAWNSRKNCAHVRERVVELTGEASVDYLIITHFHSDHAGSPRSENTNGRTQGGGGIFCLLSGTPDFFSVDTLIDRGDGEAAFKPERQRIHQAIIDSTPIWIQNGTLSQRITADFVDDTIDLGTGVDVEVISTAGRVFASDAGALANVEQNNPGTYGANSQASPNDFSVGFEISTGDFEFVSAGDLTGAPGDPPYGLAMPNGHGQIYTNVESHMVNHWQAIGRESNVEIYRVNHHGSQNSSTADLANVLRPEVVIYSAGGRYHHPTKMIADRFESLGSDQLLTTSADDAEWGPEGFPAKYGNGWLNPVDEIFIFVPINGNTYTISTAEQSFEYPVLTDTEEAEATNNP